VSSFIISIVLFIYIISFVDANAAWITKKKTDISQVKKVGNNDSIRIKAIKDLFESGALTQDQYDKALKNILDKENISYNWIAIVKHPKSNSNFIATRVSTKKNAINLAIKKCYFFVSEKLDKKGYNNCSLVNAYNDKEKIETQTVEKEPSQTEQLAKKIEKIASEDTDNDLQAMLFKIERQTPGDYYFFGHSTSGEKFWGTTRAKNQRTQIGNASSSLGYSCQLVSKMSNNRAPYNGTFQLKCPNEETDGSWTQQSNYSPGLGKAFTKNGNVVSAYFARSQSEIIDFVKIYYGDDKQTSTIEVATATQEEYKPKKTNQDLEPPKILIAEKIIVEDSSYEIQGKVTDESSKIFITIDGQIIDVKNGLFKVKRFSPIDEELQIIATDQWGNQSEPKLVNIVIKEKEILLAEKLDALDPTNIKTKQVKNRVALIIGIEKYNQTPKASFANLDAKYFYEYAQKGFGISRNNIKLLIDEDANLIESLGTINKWLPGKIKSGQTELIIFFAGHGLASADGKELYLLPQDGDPDLLARTALSRTELFDDILKLNPKSVTIFLDTCYSGVSRDEKTLLASARPVRIVANEQETPKNFSIFTASQLDQVSSGLKDAKHGIFSYYLMKGLEGKADMNKDKKITNGELLAYMDQNVSQKASEWGRAQNPSFTGDPDKILMTYR